MKDGGHGARVSLSGLRGRRGRVCDMKPNPNYANKVDRDD
jgi:hypothetical protein